MKNGILIIATGHRQYIRSAYNLALSIKAKDKDMPIAILCSHGMEEYLQEEQRMIFDHWIQTSAKWNELKLTAIDYTPFERTLLLDADVLWIHNNPKEVFELLNDIDFTAVNEGYYDLETSKYQSNPKYTIAENIIQGLKKQFNLKGDKFWIIRSEFMLFKKSKAARELFKKAWKVYNDPVIRKTLLKDTKFAGVLPDEFAFDTALNLCGMDLHESKWQPTYWPMLQGNVVPRIADINTEYYAFSFGGNMFTKAQKDMYTMILQAALYKLNKKSFYVIEPKKNFLPERSKF